MGCFPVQQRRHRAKHKLSSAASSSSLVHPSLKILKELKTGGLSSQLNNGCNSNGRNKAMNHYRSAPHSIVTPYTRARAALRSASSKLVRPNTRALASSSFSKVQIYHTEVERRGGEERSIISHSAPLLPSAKDGNEATPSAQLFPLPPPPYTRISMAAPSEDASLQSMSSTSSGSSSSSCSSAPFSGCAVSAYSQTYKSYDNPLSARSCSRTNAVDAKLPSCFAQPLPRPPASEMGTSLREFSYDELAGACLNFAKEFFIRDGGAGPVFKALVRQILDQESAVDIAVTRLSRGHFHSFKKWRAEVGTLARLSHPNICKVLGFSREDPSALSDKVVSVQRERLLVYEHTSNGSLESLLYGRKGRAPLDWGTRVKIALGAAQGLAFLHERTPRQIVYKNFKTLNIQVDHNFSAKLSDFGFARTPKELPFETPARSLPLDDAYAAPETKSYNEVTPKSNVWSFGIVLLELLSGRQNMDDFFAAEERNLLQWCRPYLLDPKRLYLVMDPELKGRYSTRKAKMVADLALQCLAEAPTARPSMREVATSLYWLLPTSDMPDAKGDETLLFSDSRSTDKSHIGNSSYLGSSIHFKYSKSYSLASVLASPARSFPSSLHLNEPLYSPARNGRTRFSGFLSGEIAKESSYLLEGARGDHPFLSRSSFLTGEVTAHAGEPRLLRSSSTSKK
ncbi:hypothetical protein GOP47_0006480 [Adiantum capillus-veneris]|uniref:Protein kinase domain-containing protein n=1 Tax=Adiantum capillus-veneris TaxID=13818 RepID=A0A9D4V2Y3_ADICA|nr:hypothetical protein GOP47_0006480 [Adiantum capillus-veneris]